MNYSYSTAAEILQINAREEFSIGEVALRAEIENSGEAREIVLARMTDYYLRMKEPVHRGLQIEERSQSGLCRRRCTTGYESQSGRKSQCFW